ncbi:MAG: hypothetical protein GY803_22050 [Chloroflexi bacterium]|nr:hypothetical protein [Chloroflexota bacterium]
MSLERGLIVHEKGGFAMNEELQTAQRDLEILEVMISELDGYLMSEATRWTMAKGDMPKLTIGGCLMRQRRLQAARDRFDAVDQARLDAALQLFANKLAKNVVRFEKRMHQELRARLADWSAYLRHMSSRMMADVNYYASVADTRVVITVMLDELRKPEYQLDPRIQEEVIALDRNLNGRWQSGDFVWPSVWQPAYSQEKYWQLYGRPK